MKQRVAGILLFIGVVLLCSAAVSAQQSDVIRIVSPAENSEVIGKKPEIRIEFSSPVDPASLVVIMDGIDLAKMGTATESSFTYQPVMALPAGPHSITVIVTDNNGGQHQRSAVFTSKQSATFEEASSNNDLSLLYESALIKPTRVTTVPYSKFEANLKTDSKIRTKHYELSALANFRYFDQSLPANVVQGQTLPGSTPGQQSDQAQPMLRKGISLMNFLITGKYNRGDFRSVVEVGDVSVTETQNTVSGLARRGGTLSLEYKDFDVKAFLVKGERVMGFYGGFGIEGSTADHIFGASAGVKLLNKRVEFRTIYVTGGEPGNGPGIATAGGTTVDPVTGMPVSTTSGAHSRGNVIGFLLKTDFFEGRLRTEAEYDYAKFAPDTTTDFGKRGDNAWRLKVDGVLGRYNYEAKYEYYGKNYAVVGNPGILKNTELATFTQGYTLEGHAFNMMLGRTVNNPDAEDLQPSSVKHDGMFSYTFSKIQNLSVTLSYMKSLQESKHEPSGTPSQDLMTDTVTGMVSYNFGPASVAYMSSWSLMNDRTSVNGDTTMFMNMLSGSYNTGNVTLSPAVTWTRMKVHTSHVWTDTYMGSMNLYSRFFRDRLTFDLGTTYTVTRSDDDAVKTDILNGNFRVGYNLKDQIRWLVDPTIALRGSYLRQRDENNHRTDREEFLMFLVLSTAIPFSF